MTLYPERLLRAIVSDFDKRQSEFFLKKPANSGQDFNIPAKGSNGTYFLGYGNQDRATFEFGHETSQTPPQRTPLAMLRFKKDPANAAHGYTLESVEIFGPPKKLYERAKTITVTDALHSAAVACAEAYYTYAQTPRISPKDAMLDALKKEINSALIPGTSGPVISATAQFSRENRLKARYGTGESASGPFDRAEFERQASRSLRGCSPDVS